MRGGVVAHLEARLLMLLPMRLLLLRLLLLLLLLLLWNPLLLLVGHLLLLLLLRRMLFLLLSHLLLVLLLLLRMLVQQAVQGLRALGLRELLQARALQRGQPGHELPQQLLLCCMRLHCNHQAASATLELLDALWGESRKVGNVFEGLQFAVQLEHEHPRSMPMC